MTHIDDRTPLPADEIDRAKVALSLITAAESGRVAFTEAAPMLLEGVLSSDDPIDCARRLIAVMWWLVHEARLCGQEMDRLAGVGFFDESLRLAGEYLATWPQCEDVT